MEFVGARGDGSARKDAPPILPVTQGHGNDFVGKREGTVKFWKHVLPRFKARL